MSILAIADLELGTAFSLPDGEETVYSDAIDLGAGGNLDDFLATVEFIVSAPALDGTALPDAETVIYAVETDDDAAFGSATVIMDAIITQTGATEVGGADAAEYRFRLPADCERYVRIAITGSELSVASAEEAGLVLVF